MRKVLFALCVAVMAAASARAQAVSIEYAHDYDFSSIKSFQYVDSSGSSSKASLMASRIVQMIKKELREGGLSEVEENPDIFVTYHVTTQDNSSFATTHFGYGGYWDGWYGWGGYGPGMGTSTTTVRTYTEGTLIIDAYDSQEKKMIWRGTGTVTIKDKPEKQVKQVNRILKKLGARWDKILAGKGK